MNSSQPTEQFVFTRSVLWTFGLLVFIWFVFGLEEVFSVELSGYGILPRKIKGLTGIFFSPFIHADFQHIIGNSFYLAILNLGLFYFYPRQALKLNLVFVLGTGLLVWLVARQASHIGYSGIIYCASFFLLFQGFRSKNRAQLAVAFVVLFLSGSSLFTGLFYTTEGVSWESHASGALVGLLSGIYYRDIPQFRSQETPFIIEDEEGWEPEKEVKEPPSPMKIEIIIEDNDPRSGNN